MDNEQMIRRALEIATELERLADDTLAAAERLQELRRKARQSRQALGYIEAQLYG
jgi:hypothetical protein